MTSSSSGVYDRPLVSIVIACFNHGAYLAESIESALAQTYAPIEVILVDDGSTDDSGTVAQRYPVLLIRQQNEGLAAAGNAGIRASRGDFVMRLDADDRIPPNYIAETLAPMLADASIHFVYTGVRYFGARTGTYPTEAFSSDSLAERNYVHASALMRRSSFDAAGRYSVDMRGLRCEDWDLWLSFAERGMRGLLIQESFLEYRQHAVPSMVTIDFRTRAGVRRELRIASRLQDHHPRLFARCALLRRLGRLPLRLWRREVTLRFAALLTALYVLMLLRSARPKLIYVDRVRRLLTRHLTTSLSC